MEQIITKAEFAKRKCVSVPTLERQETEAIQTGDDTFPRRRQLGRGRIGYLESEVDAHLRDLPAGPLVARTAAACAPEARAKAAVTRKRREADSAGSSEAA